MELPGVKARINEVFEYLAQLTGRNPQCPFCANDDWARLGGGRVVELRARQEEKPTAEPLFATALGLQCSRCGFLRLHAVDPASWGLPAAGGQ